VPGIGTGLVPDGVFSVFARLRGRVDGASEKTLHALERGGLAGGGWGSQPGIVPGATAGRGIWRGEARRVAARTLLGAVNLPGSGP
ncbi:hypothetical protein, partial [Streptomyces sp. SAJ15]|uniref:hypothetical protein n=1 Tax=Streptomyces sp. SAJ15 TaxID=2011095 RepID=UPI00135D7342